MKKQETNCMENIKNLFVHLFLLCVAMTLVMCTVKENDMQISYLDQNNNEYRVTHDSFWYTPMTPEQSSSGTYSGGEAVMRKIDVKTFSEISKVAMALVETNKDKDIKREMLTSRLTVKKKDSSTRVTLRKSKDRAHLEALLVALK